MKKTNRHFIRGWAAVLTAIALVATTACGAEEQGSEARAASPEATVAAAQAVDGTTAQDAETTVDPIKVKIADILSNPVLRVAKTKGYFEKYGIDAEIVTFATPAEGINSIFIKQVDMAWGADFPILNAIGKGGYSVIAATGTDSDAAAAQWKLFVRNEIQSGKDLQGKKLSTLRGTFLPYLWDVYLQESGVDAGQTKQIGQGGFDEAYVALKKGEIDAAWVVGAVMVDKFKGIEDAHELTDMSKTSVRLGGDILAPDTLIQEHPRAIANFLRAVDEAAQFVQAHPEETADILYKEVKQPKDATIRDIPTNNWAIGFRQDSFDSLASQKRYMVDAGIIQNDFDLSKKLYLDGIREAFPDRVTYKP